MRLLWSRLAELVPGLDAGASAAARRLTLSGLEVTRVESTPEGEVLEAEITTNRPDLLGYAGVARELAASLDREIERRAPPLLRRA